MSSMLLSGVGSFSTDGSGVGSGGKLGSHFFFFQYHQICYPLIVFSARAIFFIASLSSMIASNSSLFHVFHTLICEIAWLRQSFSTSAWCRAFNFRPWIHYLIFSKFSYDICLARILVMICFLLYSIAISRRLQRCCAVSSRTPLLANFRFEE